MPSDYFDSISAASVAMAAEILALEMGWIDEKDCIYSASPSIARMHGAEEVITVDDEQREVVVWKG